MAGMQQINVKELDDKKIDQIFAEVDEIKLSKWEFDFLTSTRNWWKQRRKLSDKQKKRLGELWAKQLKGNNANSI
jgi:hypothetical protein